MFSDLAFRHPFRKYQRMILAQIEAEGADHMHHIAAPPGSGKTIVGLELIRRFGAPAVIFTPTTTIQQQWQEKVGLFTSDQAQLAELTSLDPERLAPINIFTYQLISTPAQAQEAGRHMALQRWIDELQIDGQASDPEAARQRLELLQRHNPRDYDKELSRRYLRIKRDLLQHDAGDIAAFLHPNAQQLIQRLVDYGVRTVVLDECHHLLDYWAIVLRLLIGKIPAPHVVGLTATLPSPDDDREYENYTSLLGDVDFEVPTPAVVKEGDLAPYRDLVYFVRPSERERAYLRDIQTAFEAAIDEFATSEAFQTWVIRLVAERPGADGTTIAWEEFLNSHPLLSLAGMRFLRRVGYTLPGELPQPLEADEDLTLDDWATLLERYALDELKLSADPADHRRLAALRQALQPFGLTLTERGIRQSRSPGDLVLALSESKDRAVAHILAAEERAIGQRLRAVVVTDFERMTSGPERLGEVLERDAGSAIRVFRSLVGDHRSGCLDPILVTGKTIMVDADHGQQLLDRFNLYLRNQGLQASCSYRQSAFPGILEVAGEGRDWSPRTYVRMVTTAFEQGVTRCLVGTRGIFGEGWDALSLNTLIDMTSVTTSTSVQQLRGRTIRKDPNWPRKVAHNWDVICVAPEFKRGDSDLKRFVQRHERYWGIVPISPANQTLNDAAALMGGAIIGPQVSGAIVKGVCHVDPDLAFELATRPFNWIGFGRYTRRMLRQARQRERSYDMWGVGEEYSNFAYSTTRLQVGDLKIRTVFTIAETIKRMLRQFWATLLMSVALFVYLLVRAAPTIFEEDRATIPTLPLLGVVLILGLLVVVALNARSAYRIGRALLVEQPPDAILLDIGRALLAALKDTGQVSRQLQLDYLRVVEQPDNSYQVLLDYASPEDAATFTRAYRQMFEPPRDQRYLILRDDTRLPRVALAPFWHLLRRYFRQHVGYEPAYHPVPDLLATHKDRAETFARYWGQYVGGGELVFTRNEQGRRMLIKARGQRRPRVQSMAFETWR